MKACATAIALLGVALLQGPGLASADQSAMQRSTAGSGGVNAPQHDGKPYLVMVSVDGYGHDFPERFPSPQIQRLIDEGARARALKPVWPTLTFPNHYSQATGLPPAEHGLVGNNFPAFPFDRMYRLKDRDAVADGRFYRGTPIWVLAEQQGMVAASYFWVGSEASIQGLQPSYWYRYDGKVPNAERVEQALRWLTMPAEQRPHLITLYFDAVDSNAHWFGVGSEEMRAAVAEVDQQLGRLMDGIDALPHGQEVYLLVMSDHGQRGYHDEPAFQLGEHIDLAGLTVVDQGPAVYVWGLDESAAASKAERINALWQHGTAYTRASAPPEWRLPDNPRFPDLVFQAESGYAVRSGQNGNEPLMAGDHGWPPDDPTMHGFFLARGPGITAGGTLPALHATDVFPLIVEWLGLDYPEGYTHRAPLDRTLSLPPGN